MACSILLLCLNASLRLPPTGWGLISFRLFISLLSSTPLSTIISPSICTRHNMSFFRQPHSLDTPLSRPLTVLHGCLSKQRSRFIFLFRRVALQAKQFWAHALPSITVWIGWANKAKSYTGLGMAISSSPQQRLCAAFSWFHSSVWSSGVVRLAIQSGWLVRAAGASVADHSGRNTHLEWAA